MQDRPKRREILLKRTLYICVAVYIVTLLYAFYHNYTVRGMNVLGMTPVVVPTPLIVPIASKLPHFESAYEIYIVPMIFMYFASLIGSSYHRYSYLGFGKVLHSFSDWFITTLAVILYSYLKKMNESSDKKDYHIFFAFINAVNIAVGEVWEFYEYIMLIFFNNDCINHYSQGVHDMVTDALYATVAGILPMLLIMCYHKTEKGNFFTNAYEKSYERNIVGKQTGFDNIRLTGVCCVTNMMTKNRSG